MNNKNLTHAVKSALIKAHLAGKIYLDLNSLMERYNNLHEPFVYTLKRDPEEIEIKSTGDLIEEYDIS